MKPNRISSRAVLLAAAMLAPQAQAATCSGAGAAPLTVGTVAAVPPGSVHSFTLGLGSGEGVIVDLSGLTAAAGSSGDDDHEGHEGHEGRGGQERTAPAARSLTLCGSDGALLAPQLGEVFEKGGSVSNTDEGERLRFVAQSAGQYIVRVASADAPRELLVRRRDSGVSRAPVVSATLDTPQRGLASSAAPMVFSFSGTAGQWVELSNTSEKDTVLRLAGPDREGSYSIIAENDDSEGLNPLIRRRLPLTGAYFLQVDSLSEEAGEFELELKRIAAPKPPPPPLALRVGAQLAGRLAGTDDVRLYALPVIAGRSYRLDLTAPYDAVVAIGLPNPVEAEDGKEGADAGFSEVKSRDDNLTGTEKLTFTARSSGQLLVRVKSFGIGETDGGYTLTASDVGG